MSLNGSGVFSVNSAGQPVVASTLITSAAFNAFTADVATALSTCILKDGQQTVTANIPFGGNKLTGVAAGTARTDAANIGLLQDGTGVYVATVGGTVDVITLTPSPAITAYTAGMSFKFIAAGANTTNVTVNVSGLGAKAVTKTGSTALVGGDLPSGAIVHATYDGTRFQVQVGQATINASTLISNLVSYVHPDVNTAHRDSIKAGYIPAWFQQGWGGGINGYELVDAATGTPYKFESATGYIEDNTSLSAVANAAANTWVTQGFKVSTTQSISAIWVKVYKTGNPTNNLEMRILPDDGSGTKPTGSTAITNGTATAMSGKLFESGDTTGQWVRFVFATPCALTANTFYHVTLKSSGAFDASNCWNWKGVISPSNKYPHGNNALGDATPTWTAYVSDHCFLVEAPATTATFQSGGIFGDGKAVFYEGSPLNQSNQRRADLADLKGINLGSMTALWAGTAQTKDKTLADFFYGSTENRAVLRCAVTTGFPTLTLYDSSGTARTVTGTTDISSGDHAVAMKVIANTGSGTDKLELWVDGASQGTAITGVAITFDELFRQGQIGSKWDGGGFPLAPTWTGSSILTGGFSGLPSTLGWTWTGAATEANANSVSGGLHYYNKSGYTALQDGYYAKTITAVNATGTVFEWVGKINSATNTAGSGFQFQLNDGTKTVQVSLQEYFATILTGGTTYYVQFDFKSNTNTVQIQTKGSDMYLVVNGRLLFDGTGLLTTGTATNALYWGDFSGVSGEQFDAITKSIKYYTGGLLMPQATAGSLSEWAIWTGDKTSILATLYNSGSPISVKQFCGLGVNWKRGDDGAWVHRVVQQGITNSPTTTSASYTTVTEMEGFVFGDFVSMDFNLTLTNNQVAGSQQLKTMNHLDGASLGGESDLTNIANGYSFCAHVGNPKRTYFGPHKAEGKNNTSGGTSTWYQVDRNITIEGRS